MQLCYQLASNMTLHMKFLKVFDKHQNKNCCSYIYEHEQMKMNSLSYMIKYLPCFLVNFQAVIHKNLLLAKCSNPTTIYIIKRFHLHYRELPFLQMILSIVTTTLLLKVFKRIVNFYSYHLTNVYWPIFQINSRIKSLSKYICFVL